jgi:hypothetical protein
MSNRILSELKNHAPFTVFGALTGIVLMLAIVLAKVPPASVTPAFLLFHGLHVFLSAIVTAAMYRRYRKHILPGVVIGIVGSLGIATLSDVVFPYHGGALLLSLTTERHDANTHEAEESEGEHADVGEEAHADLAALDEEAHDEHGHHAEAGHDHQHMHIGFIDHWWLINPLAVLGVAIGMFKPRTKVPHAGHVLLSTWASLLYMVAYGNPDANWLPVLPLVFVVLFIAVWLPCCVSDIVFPLLFVGKEALDEEHHHHGHH